MSKSSINLNYLREIKGTIRISRSTSIKHSRSRINWPVQPELCIQEIEPLKSEKISIEEYQELQAYAKDAQFLKRVYAIDGNKEFPNLTEALERRGWAQKFYGNHLSELMQENENLQKKIILSNMLASVKINFIWLSPNNTLMRTEMDHPLCNRITKYPHSNDFTTKLGLTIIYNQMQWLNPDDIYYPRSYAIQDVYEKIAFIEDFRLTCCTSFLRFINSKVYSEMSGPECSLTSISSKIIDTAISIVNYAIILKNHGDLDNPEPPNNVNFDHLVEMEEFIRRTKDTEAVLITDIPETLVRYIMGIKAVLREAMKHFPHILQDGYHNVWIVKPCGCNCGYGIEVFNKEIDILKHMEKNGSNIFILQKYIENPLLIHNTKFDIRQYFLIVMDGFNINIWLYGNCYLKFSGQEFSLTNLAREIHITNHTVQKMFKNGDRSAQLPTHNMWIRDEFLRYLTSIGQANKWALKIFPGIEKSLLTVLKGSLDVMEFRRNNFQLYGADFIITDDFNPVLLEINSSPDLRSSTVSTEILCKSVVEDMIKVLIDTKNNKYAKTGDFKLIYSERANVDLIKQNKLHVVGKRLRNFIGTVKGR